MTQVRMAEEWYINTGGRVEGPLSVTELKDRAADGLLAPTDSVSPDGVHDWGPASAIADLTFPPRPRRALLETVVSGSVNSAATRPPVAAAAADVDVEGFEILETLGVGSFGAVYKAQQKTPKRLVALKTMLLDEGPSDGAENARVAADALSRFRKEADSQAQLQHPNIAAVYQYGVCRKPAGRAYFAMELLAGEDLNARLDRDGPVDEFTAWMIAKQAAAALAHAAAHDIVHRDIKPANLFLVDVPTGLPIPKDVGFVKVTDFGLALTQVAADARSSSVESSGSASGMTAVAGTPVYMAPEQFNGAADLRSDIYGLGATVYHALNGQPPFDGRSMWDVAMKKTSPAPRLEGPVSVETADLVADMLAINPAARPQNYEALLERIKNLPCMAPDVCPVRPQVPPSKAELVMPQPNPPGSLADMSISNPVVVIAPPPPAEHRSRRWWFLGLAGAVLLGCAIGVFKGQYFFWPNEQAQVQPPPVDPPDEPDDRSQVLFAHGNIARWEPQGDAKWAVVQPGDRPTNPDWLGTLTGTGRAVRRFDPPPPNSFRVTLNLDFSETERVELVIAATPAGDRQFLIVIDNADKTKPKIAVGSLTGRGDFVENKELGWKPLPSAAELRKGGKSPFVELKYTRAGKRIAVPFSGGLLVGEDLNDGLQTTELKINVRGGPIYIDAAALEDLTVNKK